jgi:ribosomal protein S18 acetylase RimI-like enzyme
MTHISVRDYEPSDAEAVVALVSELQDHESQFYDRLKPASEIGQWYITNLQEETSKHDGALLVAVTGDAVAGFASLLTRCEANGPEEVAYTHAHIGDLVVGTKFRRMGVGVALMTACEQRAKAAGQKWLRLSVLAANAEARAFYANSGFNELLVKLEKPLA